MIFKTEDEIKDFLSRLDFEVVITELRNSFEVIAQSKSDRNFSYKVVSADLKKTLYDTALMVSADQIIYNQDYYEDRIIAIDSFFNENEKLHIKNIIRFENASSMYKTFEDKTTELRNKFIESVKSTYFINSNDVKESNIARNSLIILSEFYAKSGRNDLVSEIKDILINKLDISNASLEVLSTHAMACEMHKRQELRGEDLNDLKKRTLLKVWTENYS